MARAERETPYAFGFVPWMIGKIQREKKVIWWLGLGGLECFIKLLH
jgi:hypothetical protein